MLGANKRFMLYRGSVNTGCMRNARWKYWGVRCSAWSTGRGLVPGRDISYCSQRQAGGPPALPVGVGTTMGVPSTRQQLARAYE